MGVDQRLGHLRMRERVGLADKDQRARGRPNSPCARRRQREDRRHRNDPDSGETGSMRGLGGRDLRRWHDQHELETRPGRLAPEPIDDGTNPGIGVGDEHDRHLDGGPGEAHMSIPV
jgi:hypothetical protein